MFLPSVCLAPAGLFCHPISAVSLRRLTTYILLDFKVAKRAVSSLTHCSNPFQICLFQDSWFKYCIIFKMYRKGKDIRKRDIQFLSFQICVVTNLSALSCFCLCYFCISGEVSNSCILNDIGRNRNRRKISKFLMRTFTCRSTFLYAWNPGHCLFYLTIFCTWTGSH